VPPPTYFLLPMSDLIKLFATTEERVKRNYL